MIRFIGVFFTTFVLLHSCSDDLSKDSQMEFASVYVNESGEAEYFTLDSQETLYVVKSQTAYKPKNERVFIQYKMLSDNYMGFSTAIELENYIYDIPTKDIVFVPESETVKQDSIGYDPVNLLAGQAKGNFITLRFQYKMSGDRTQTFSLIQRNEFVDFTQPIELEFRHNYDDDKPNYVSNDAYMCFDIKPYLENSRNLVFKINWVDYDSNPQYLLVPYNKQ